MDGVQVDRERLKLVRRHLEKNISQMQEILKAAEMSADTDMTDAGETEEGPAAVKKPVAEQLQTEGSQKQMIHTLQQEMEALARLMQAADEVQIRYDHFEEDTLGLIAEKIR
ncbi:MAG: hypothetical protein IKE03_03695 [Blautia sp.]|nr:hypothetical protein [Blautia sp.]